MEGRSPLSEGSLPPETMRPSAGQSDPSRVWNRPQDRWLSPPAKCGCPVEAKAPRPRRDQGWPHIIDCYRQAVASASDRTGATWVALVHRPGPAAPMTGSVFEEPLFAEHLAFLQRMRDAGYLVAAGPVGDGRGEGMTILRLPGVDRLEQARKLATEDDVSVASGFFTVTVRHWQVRLTG